MQRALGIYGKREVEEEVGVKGKILHELTPVTYTYEWKGEKREKTVYMFVMKYLEGDITKHDWEMEEVIWLPIDEARKKLTHQHSKNVLDEAVEWFKQKDD
jgi:8-oxo-dGTP diphosphatase